MALLNTQDGYANMDGLARGESVKNLQVDARLGFVRKVYGILSIQLIITTIVAGVISTQTEELAKTNPGLLVTLLYGSSAASLSIICALTCCPQTGRSYPGNYIMLGIFTLAESVTVGFICSQYPAKLVLGCAGLTAFIFVGLSVYAWTTKQDFTGYGPYLMGALLAMVIFGFGMFFLGGIPFLSKVYAGIMVLLFTFYIVYDTQCMLGCHKGHKMEFSLDDYVFAALNLYLDIINLFLYLLELFGSRR